MQWNNSFLCNKFIGTPRDQVLTVKNLRDMACMSNPEGPNYLVLCGRD
jgi:hypothetical protein